MKDLQYDNNSAVNGISWCTVKERSQCTVNTSYCNKSNDIVSKQGTFNNFLNQPKALYVIIVKKSKAIKLKNALFTY